MRRAQLRAEPLYSTTTAMQSRSRTMPVTPTRLRAEVRARPWMSAHRAEDCARIRDGDQGTDATDLRTDRAQRLRDMSRGRSLRRAGRRSYRDCPATAADARRPPV